MFQIRLQPVRNPWLWVLLLLVVGVLDVKAQAQRGATPFPLQRDHLFIWVSEGAPEAAILQKLGLYTKGAVNQHSGQGTSSIVFMFDNAYLELIWIDDPEVAKSRAREMGTDLLARAAWRQTKASPFGVGLHRRADSKGELPFPTRKYRAQWMKPDTFIDFAESSADTKEPMYFVVPDYLAVFSPAQLELLLKNKPEYKSNYAHPLGVHQLTGVRIVAEGAGAFSRTAALLSGKGVIAIERGRVPYAELTFDGGAKGKSLDMRPALPLTLKY
jgi:hypothetical protein